MRINFSCFDILMTELLLHGANVGTRFQEVGSEGMPQRVAGHMLLNTRPLCGQFDNLVNR